MSMTLREAFEDERFRFGLATFASLYAKRILEGQYDRLLATPAGQQLANLSRPTKLGIEAALNLLAAYLSTHEVAFSDRAWTKAIYQVLTDAPSEIAARLLRQSDKRAPQFSTESHPTVSAEQQAAWEALGQLEPATLERLARWLRTADATQRQQLADYLVKTVEAHATGSGTESPTDAQTNTAPRPSPATPEAPTRSPSLLSDLARALSGLNVKLESRKAQEGDAGRTGG